MLRLSPLALRMVPCACAQLPEMDPVKGEFAARVTVSDWLLPLLRDTKPTQLLMCDVESPHQPCNRERLGLDAAGVGASSYPSKFLYQW